MYYYLSQLYMYIQDRIDNVAFLVPLLRFKKNSYVGVSKFNIANIAVSRALSMPLISESRENE